MITKKKPVPRKQSTETHTEADCNWPGCGYHEEKWKQSASQPTKKPTDAPTGAPGTADIARPAALPAEITPPPALIERAIQSGASAEILERLLALQERWEQNQARKAYAAAISDLRADLPEIVKQREVDFSTDRGRTHYRYEDLQAVTEALSPAMAKHGLSFRWRTASNGPDVVTVTCIVSHRDGHSEEVPLTAKHDTSGNKNPIQAIGSAVTYLQRYTLKAAVGVAAARDDDAQSATPERVEKVPREFAKLKTESDELKKKISGLEGEEDKPEPKKSPPRQPTQQKNLTDDQEKLKKMIQSVLGQTDASFEEILVMVTQWEPYTRREKGVDKKYPGHPGCTKLEDLDKQPGGPTTEYAIRQFLKMKAEAEKRAAQKT